MQIKQTQQTPKSKQYKQYNHCKHANSANHATGTSSLKPTTAGGTMGSLFDHPRVQSGRIWRHERINTKRQKAKTRPVQHESQCRCQHPLSDHDAGAGPRWDGYIPQRQTAADYHYSPKALGQSDYGDGANRPFQEQTGLGTITNLIGVS